MNLTSPIVHNSQCGNDFVVRIGAPGITAAGAMAVAQWVGRACISAQSWAPSAFGPWSVVFSDVDDDDRFDVLLHNNAVPELPCSIDGFLILESTPRLSNLEARYIVDVLRSTPYSDELPQLERLGVSAVSPDAMAKLWWATIGGAAGFKKRPMFYGSMTHTVFERSWAFGWRAYPPEESHRCGDAVRKYH